MPESFTPREFIEKINADNPGPAFDPYEVEALLKRQQTGSAATDLLSEAKARVEEERAKNTPEGQIAELEQQIEDMRQWLIQDGTYSQAEVDDRIRRLSVEYNQDKQQAEVIGNLYLNSLTSAEDLVLPQSIGGSLNLGSLTSAEGLELPQSIGVDLYLGSLTSAEDLVLPQSIGRDIYLDDLTSAEDLVLPQSIGGALSLNSLTSAEDLVLPQSIGGDLVLDDLTSAERNQIRAQRPDLADKIYPRP
jgi:hypothetical protein